jgi:hypothetical protein
VNNDDPMRLYSVAQLAELWSVSETYIRTEIREHRLAVVQLGNGDRDKSRVRAAEAQRWLSERTSGAA